MRPRSLARRLALQYLFMKDLAGEAVEQSANDFLYAHTDIKEARVYAAELVNAVVTDQERIDGQIRQYAKHWTLERMAPVERNALRIGCAELGMGTVPPGVVIDEAVKIAKVFGSKDSGGFVNGVLDRIKSAACLEREGSDD